MNWAAAGTIIAGLGVLGAYMSWFVRVTMREQLDKLLADINGTYVRSAKSTLTGAEIERRLGVLEGSMGD